MEESQACFYSIPVYLLWDLKIRLADLRKACHSHGLANTTEVFIRQL